MKHQLKDAALLEDLLFYIEKLQKFDAIESDEEMKAYSIRMCLAQIGECVRKISNETKNCNTDVAWNEVIATRNVIIHNYSGFDEEIEDSIIQHDIPELKEKIQKIINEQKQ